MKPLPQDVSLETSRTRAEDLLYVFAELFDPENLYRTIRRGLSGHRLHSQIASA